MQGKHEMTGMKQSDIAVIGAGPVGLAMARALASLQVSTVLIDPATPAHLAQPPNDGREIALTHASRALLEQLGVWSHLPSSVIFPLRLANVIDGCSPCVLRFAPDPAQGQNLGWLVPNAHLRQASWRAIAAQAHLDLQLGKALEQIRYGSDGMSLQLSDGQTYHTRLLIVADGRRSLTRQLLGIGAQMRLLGQQMLLCRMQLEYPAAQTALQWFQYGQTVAILPLAEQLAGVVLTLPPDQIASLRATEPSQFNQRVTELYQRRFGQMILASERYVSPLLVSYADTFSAKRAALIGDAAVGMHPMTAHGYNFGLRSVVRLVAQLRAALHAQHDIGDAGHLSAYARQHRLATYPLYRATLAIASVYARHGASYRLLRPLLLRAAHGTTPFRRAVAAQLTRASAW